MGRIDPNAVAELNRRIDSDRDKIAAMYGAQWGARLERVRHYLLWSCPVTDQVIGIQLLLVNGYTEAAEEHWLALRTAVEAMESGAVDRLIASIPPVPEPVTEPVTVPLTEVVAEERTFQHERVARHLTETYALPRWAAARIARFAYRAGIRF